MSRTKNATRNIIIGFVYKCIVFILPFINRTFIIRYLGAEYQGLDGLFTSILTVLNLVELGFSSAIAYSMYALIANSEMEQIRALLNYFKRIYRIIGIIILACGVVLLPFISYLINGSYPQDINIYLLYGVYLSQTVITYFVFGYKSVILTANQRLDLVNKSLMITAIVRGLIQLFLLIVTRNFYFYVIVLPIFSLINNLLTAKIANKIFPDYYAEGNISLSLKEKIKKQVSGLVINKVSNAIRNASDNIIISTFFGLSILSVYNNYFTIMNFVYSVDLMIIDSIMAGIGNSIQVENEKKNYQDFMKFSLMFTWFNVFCTTSLYVMFQPFIIFWIGECYLLSQISMTLFCIYHYILVMASSLNAYYDGNGYWWRGKQLYIWQAVFNIVFNIILGKLFGIPGIIVSTVVSIILFPFIGRLRQLYSGYFKDENISIYYRKQSRYIVVAIVSCFITSFICDQIVVGKVVNFFVRVIASIFISSLLMFISSCKTDEFKQSKKFILMNVLRRSN